MRTPSRQRSVGVLVVLLALSVLSRPAQAQGQGPTPVRWTEARTADLRDTVRLPGDVQAHVEAVLAAEVAGLVVDLPAREGARVRTGDVIARLRSDALQLRLAAARGRRTEAQARLDRAGRQLDRARGLIAEEAISPEQLDEAASEFEAWQGRLQQLDAEIASIELDIERCTIRALFDGVVVLEHCEVAEWLGVGDPVFEVVSREELEVHVDVPERYYGALVPGTKVQVGFSSVGDLQVEAELSAIIPRARANARTFPVELTLRDPDPRIGIGMLTQVRMPVGAPREVTIVPKDAIVSGPRGRVVWVVEDDRVRSVPVEMGDALGVWVAVSGEITPGTKVVVRGNERLRPQSVVRGEAMEYELP